ncbi:MAG TPA: TIGR02269 family lipoprotein [Archangium sp.]|uniref:SitA6 family polymorphic toxin lipoprotein n=1 Tax=Archangium sp. TaxID=1872627 RepID=UPI002E3385EE|nr:TIGR02269 family lipoprotein [Archangium sp.]HEX5753135.1 TIGR02269 family lipoprotein [Archangium sp.]
MMRRWVLLLGVLLAGCAASGPSSRGEEALEEADTCLALLCDEEVCGFFRCEDVAVDGVASSGGPEAEEGAEPGRVVLARTGSTTVGINLPSPVTPMRYRGWPLRYPGEREPVFVIPWKNHPLRNLLPSQKQLIAEANERFNRPHEKHHIFPQEFKAWFKEKGIDIHQWTMLIEKDLHARIHRGPSGGPWNAAWRQFKMMNNKATQEEIWKYAWELCVRFGLYAPLRPYYGSVPLPPPIGY